MSKHAVYNECYMRIVNIICGVKELYKMTYEVLELLKVLMWKHFVVRGRKYLLTPVEILSPLVYFLLIHVICYHFTIDILAVPQMHEEFSMTSAQDTVSTY